MLDPDELLRVIVARAKRLFGGECGIHLLSDGGWLVPRIDTDPAATARRVALGEGALGGCAASRRGALVNDYPTWPEAVAAAPRGSWGVPRPRVAAYVAMAEVHRRGDRCRRVFVLPSLPRPRAMAWLVPVFGEAR